MTIRKNPPGRSLPCGWPRRVKSATLHVISLAQFALAYTCPFGLFRPRCLIRTYAFRRAICQDILDFLVRNIGTCGLG